ncbi:MAG: redoxin domain-containing protein [Chitinophagales bacterium]|nr:redoxin domain-containing protein [Chitinophagales bacterium]
MKKYCTLFCLILFTTLTFSQENNFNITLTVKGMENQIGILAFYFGDKRFVKDTLNFDAKGVAVLKGKKNIAEGVYLVAFPSMRYSSFDLIIKETSFSISTDTSNFIKNVIVKNSVENKQMFEDMNYMMPLGLENDSLQKKLKGLNKKDSAYKKIAGDIEAISKKIVAHRKEITKKYPTTFYSKLLNMMLDIEIPEGPKNPNGSLVDTFYSFHYTQKHYFDNIDFADSGYIRTPVFQSKLLKYFDNYTFPQPDSIIKSIDMVVGKSRANKDMFQFCLNELFLKYAKSEIMGHDAIYVYLSDKYYLSGEAWWATEKSLTELRDRVEAVKPTLIGKIAPNFIVQDSSGKMQVFHDYVSKNKYTVLVFWNSDCGHCQHEIPVLKKLYTDSLQALGVRVFAVSTEQTDSSFRAFAAKNCSPQWITCADMRGVSAFRKEYDIIATPKVFVITQDYKIIAKNMPVDNLVGFIQFMDGLEAKDKNKQ